MARPAPRANLLTPAGHDEAVRQRINRFIEKVNREWPEWTQAQKLEQAWGENILEREKDPTDPVGRDADYYFAARKKVADSSSKAEKVGKGALGRIAWVVYAGVKLGAKALGHPELTQTDSDLPHAPVGGFDWMNEGIAAGFGDRGNEVSDLALYGMALTGSEVAAPATTGQLSGAAWWHANQSKYPNSNSVEDLEPGFRSKVKEFLAALQQAGATVNIASTRRSKQRAYLMHYSWKVAKGQTSAPQVPAEPGVDIVWTHSNDAQSKHAAQEMLNLFGMAHIASLTSRHIEGKAIDMSISWTGTLKIKNKAGQVVEVAAPQNGANNTTLHSVGSSYGVKKLATDAPHWSTDGQ